MSFCGHCGKTLAEDELICLGCGCRTNIEFTLTLKRESQFFIVNPEISIDIIGNGIRKNLKMTNGQVLPVKLPQGKYSMRIYSGAKEEICSIDLMQDTYFRIAWNRFNGKIEAWEISNL